MVENDKLKLDFKLKEKCKTSDEDTEPKLNQSKSIVSENLSKFFNSEIDFKIYTFLDSKSILNLMLSSKIIYELFRNVLINNYFRSVPPSIHNLKQVIKMWLLLLNNKQNKKRSFSKSFTISNNNTFRNSTSSTLNTVNESFSNSYAVQNLSPNSPINNDIKKNPFRVSTFTSNDIESIELKKKSINNFNNIEIKDDLNTNLNIKKEISNEKSFNFEKIKGDISRDVGRTFHYGRFLEQSGKNQLTTILEKIAINNPDIGYCQGMNFVAGALLEITDSVETATHIFQKVMDHYDLYYLYIEVRKLITSI
jgi:hypothetical protein